jgi:alpha-L-fucosidase
LPWGRTTEKGNTLYLHVFDWPSGGKLEVSGIGAAVKSARLLGGGSVDVKSSGDSVVVQGPAQAPDTADSVIALELS